jgi:protein-tyrosine kinase
MSRNFELLQNIGKEQEYFRSDSAVGEPQPVSSALPSPLIETVSAPLAPAEPSQFSTESSQLAELAKLVQRVFLLPGAEQCRTVVFASSESGNGCSWICARAGELLASQVTGSVCLVDANLHTPTLHEQFGVPNHYGLSNALRQPGSIRGYVSQLSRRNLALVSCGSDLKDAQGLVATDRMRTRLNELRSEFDYVLIDGSSLDVSNDTVGLGSMADGVVLVLKANATRKERARGVVHDLRAANVRVLGAVLNQRTFPIPDALYKKL